MAKSIQKDSSYKKKILQLRKEHEVLRKHTKMSQQQIRKRLLDDTSTTSDLTIHVPQPSSVTLKKSSSVSPKEEKESPPSMKRHKSNKHPSSSSSSPKSPTHSVTLPPTITNNVSKKVNQGTHHKFVHHHISAVSNSNINNDKVKNQKDIVIRKQVTSPINNGKNGIITKNSKLIENIKSIKKNKPNDMNIKTGNKNNPLPMMPLQQSPLPLNIFPVINESWPPLDISAFQNTSQSSMSHIYDPYIVQQQHLISQPSSISTNPVDLNTSNSFLQTIPTTHYYNNITTTTAAANNITTTTTTVTNPTLTPTPFQQSNLQDPLSYL